MGIVGSKWRREFFALALILFITKVLVAQSDLSSITGSVHDPSGSAVPNAKITVKNDGNGETRNATTNAQGNFTVPTIPSGFYTITVEAEGFKKYQASHNKLDAAVPLGINVALQLGAISETVDVSADAQRLQTETATVGKIVDETQVKNLGLNGRNPLFLAQLKPGVRGGSMANFSFSLDNAGLSINGARSEDSAIYFDGAVGTRTRSAGTSIGVANADTVQEVQVLTANYTAEYGRSAGGQTRIVTKSGGHDFHGDAWEYVRNDVFNANDWSRNNSPDSNLSSTPAPFRFNQFGFDLNGPVTIPGLFNKDRQKIFFNVGEEWVNYNPTNTLTAKVPSLAMRQGDFSELLQPNNFFYSQPRYIRDPQKSGTCNATDQTACFPGNIIPKDRLNQTGVALLNIFPAPTAGYAVGGNNYISSGPAPQRQRKDTYGLDIIPTEKHSIRLRAQNFAFTSDDAYNGSWPIAPTHFDRPNQSGSVNWIWTISPTMINEFLSSVSADHVDIGIVGDSYHRSAYGVNYPYLYPGSTKDIQDKLPSVMVNDYTEISGSPYPSRSGGPIYQFSDNFTKIWGAHTIKFGALYEYSGQNDRDQINVTGIPGGTNNQAGRFIFSNGREGGTGTSVADAALGLFDTYGEIGPRAYTPYRGSMWEYFIQDSWRVTPKLKIEYGIRHTMVQPYYSQWGNMAVFDAKYYNPASAAVIDPKTGAILSGDPYNGIVIPGSGFPSAAQGRVPAASDPQFQRLFHNTDKYYSQRHWNDIVPRIGVAYAVNDKTVVRAGFGGFKNRQAVSDGIFLGGNAPFQGFQTVQNGVVDNPGGTSALFPTFVQTMDPVLKTPTAYNWNFTVERQVKDMIITGAYVGRVGLHLERIRNLNQLEPGTLQANPGINTDTLRPYQGFSQIQIAENAARSTYNALQLEVSKRFSKGLSFGAAYTFSKSYDNASSRKDVLWNNYDASNFWGPSSFDTRQVLIVNVVYELPFFRDKSHLKGKLLGGWQISAISQWQTGTPFTVGDNTDYAGIGTASFQPWYFTADPTSGASGKFSSGSDGNYYFNPNVFQKPTPGTFSNQTRNRYYNPGFQNHNLSLMKNFNMTERQFFQFRADAFNWVNHPNWSSVESNPNNANFARVTGKTSSRQLQLSLRYTF